MWIRWKAKRIVKLVLNFDIQFHFNCNFIYIGSSPKPIPEEQQSRRISQPRIEQVIKLSFLHLPCWRHYKWFSLRVFFSRPHLHLTTWCVVGVQKSEDSRFFFEQPHFVPNSLVCYLRWRRWHVLSSFINFFAPLLRDYCWCKFCPNLWYRNFDWGQPLSTWVPLC